MERDHAVAEKQARSAWQRERRLFEQRHRAQLQNYVETRLAIAEDNARLNFIRMMQLAQSAAVSRSSAGAGASDSTAWVTDAAADVADVWIAQTNQASDTHERRPAPQRLFDQAAHIVREVPKRTGQVFAGNDELVTSSMAHGLPKGLAVFFALLMLHVPSFALASLVTGVFLIRGHRSRLGAFFLGLAAILGVVIFFVLPW